jgi:hypothetical protein
VKEPRHCGKQRRHTADPESLTTSVVRMKLVGANPRAEVSGLKELPSKSNYFIGNDPQKWRTDVPNYAKVRHQEVYPGVDLVYTATSNNSYDFVVAPGADPKAITLNMGTDLTPSRKGHSEAASLRIDANGDLLVHLNGGTFDFISRSCTNQHSTPDSRLRTRSLSTADISLPARIRSASKSPATTGVGLWSSTQC